MKRPLVMGVVNVTPDSFSDGGVFAGPDAAAAHGRALVADGADMLDIGGEATNPRARPIGAEEELARVLPVIERLAGCGVPLSIDTTKAAVAEAAVRAGATIVNDVSGGLFDPEMVATVRRLGDEVTYIAGHLRGRTLAEVFADERPVSFDEVADGLAARVRACAGVRTWVDPGIGFGKGADPRTNLELLRRSGELAERVGCPVVVGPSRKRFLARIIGDGEVRRDVDGWLRLDVATIAASLGAARAGAHVVRVHNVALLEAALAVYVEL